MKPESWYADQANRARLRGMLATLAHDQLGVKESPPGSNHVKYGVWFGMNGLAWCAQYVSWLYGQTCQSLDVPNPLEGWQTRRGFAGVTGTWAVIKKRYPNYIVTNGVYMTGDICFWDHDQVSGGPGHTGMIMSPASYSKMEFITSEGNTNSAYSRTGGEVAEHRHILIPGQVGHHGLLLGVARPTRRFWAP